MSEVTKVSFPSYMREKFEQEVDSLNKKLRRIKGASEVSVIEEKEFIRQHPSYKSDFGSPLKIEFTEVIITMPVKTKHLGYEWLGTVSIKDGVKSIYAINGDNIADIELMTCDHCGHNRKRNHVFVFRKTKDACRITIGSTCVDEFFGLSILKSLDIFQGFCEQVSKEWDNDDFRGGRIVEGYGREYVYAATLCAYRSNSVYEKSSDFSSGTAFLVRVMMTDAKTWAGVAQGARGTIEKDAESLDALLIATYGSLDASASNFNSNVKDSLFAGSKLREFIPFKAQGLFIWAIFNALNKEAKAKEQSTKVNEYIGSVGEKVTVKGIVKSVKSMGSFVYNGPVSMLVVLDTPNGVVKTFTTAGWVDAVKEGDEISLNGKVKSHEIWKEWKSTLLTHTKKV